MVSRNKYTDDASFGRTQPKLTQEELRAMPLYVLEYFAPMQVFGEPYRAELSRRQKAKTDGQKK